MQVMITLNILKKEKEKTKVNGISFPVRMWNMIDRDRDDITRSKYLLRLVEKAYSYGSFDKESKTNIK